MADKNRNTSPSRAMGEDDIIHDCATRGIEVVGWSAYKQLRLKGKTKAKLIIVRNHPYTKCHGWHGNMDLTLLYDDVVLGFFEVKNQEYGGSAAERWYCAVEHGRHLMPGQFLAVVCSGTFVHENGEIAGIVKDLQENYAKPFREGRHHCALGVRKDVEVFNREDVEDEKRFQAYLDQRLRAPVVC